MKTPKLYDSVRHPEGAANITTVGGLVILVHQIRQGEVLLVLNPNLQHFGQGRDKQDVEFECTEDTVFLRLTPTCPPVQAWAAGLVYDVSLAEIDSESKAGVNGALDYCVFDVIQHPDSTKPV
jgi:hypothetical protein